MQLTLEKAITAVERDGIPPIFMISGDEPLQMAEATDAMRSKCRQHDVTERVVLEVIPGFDWNRLIEESVNMSLFSSKRLLELRMGSSKPGQEGSKVLIEYAKKITDVNILLITANKVDKQTQKSKWYTALNQLGIMVQIWPIDFPQLPQWVSRRVQKYNKSIDHDAAQCIADYVEGNLLAASQEIKKLCLLVDDDKITVEVVMEAVTDNTRFNVFSLLECAYANEPDRLLRILNGLKNEGLDPMAIYGPIIWDYRRLCVLAYHLSQGARLNDLLIKYRIWGDTRKQAIRAILQRHSVGHLYMLLTKANKIERMIKSTDKKIVWDALLALLLNFSGHVIQTSS
ncbi:DNA polymerase III delta subunit [uncultured Candidatus Thioglobus sp.]|nr:DNA polymerase III delta subunit [uncultured Candidatus Thioglobus sp.]